MLHVLCEIKNLAYGEIDERSFSNPHPWSERKMWFEYNRITVYLQVISCDQARETSIPKTNEFHCCEYPCQSSVFIMCESGYVYA